MLIKNCLCESIKHINLRIHDQIWFQLHCVPSVLFGVCYIPLMDSQYYTHESFSSIQEKLLTTHIYDTYFIIGDMNARFETFVCEQQQHLGLPASEYWYPVLPDE